MKVDIGRAGIVAILAGLVLVTVMIAGFVYAAVDSDDAAVTIVGYCFAAIFGILWAMIVVRLPVLLQRRGLVFDERGVHYWHGESWSVLAWEDVAAVGIGYEQPPDLPKIPTSIEGAIKDVLEDRIKDVLKLDGKRRVAVEIFPVTLESMQGHTALARYRREYPAPLEGLPSVRWRIALPPVIGVARGIGRGVESFQPQRWLGWFARPWRGALPYGRRYRRY